MEDISPLQQKIYEFIVHFLRIEGMPPTNREIGEAVGIASTGHINHHLNILAKRGWIKRRAGKGRGIQLARQLQGIPLIGTIAAGTPLDIYEVPYQLLVPDEVIGQNDEVYALQVRGESMIEDLSLPRFCRAFTSWN